MKMIQVRSRWETFPEGDTGIWNPEFGKVQSEHNMVVLNNGDLYVVYRTIDGSPAYSISPDDGKTFSKPQYMTYKKGQRIGNPRACPKIFKTEDGKYLFWFHNNFRKNSYNGRNPAWISGGTEERGNILWSQPEIVLYDNDPAVLGMSYPDFIEENGRLWITETQKNAARIHEINTDIIEGMWNQGKVTDLTFDGLIMNSDAQMLSQKKINFPQLPDLSFGGSFTLEFWMTVTNFSAGQQLFSTIGPKHKGIKVSLQNNNTIEIELNDGEIREADLRENTIFTSDKNRIAENELHHIVFIIDGAAKIATVLVDGILSDGDIDERDYGWGRIYPYLKGLNDTNICILNRNFDGTIHLMKVYNRALRTSEAISNYNAGLKAN